MTDHELQEARQKAQLAVLQGRKGALPLLELLDGVEDWADAEMTWTEASERIGELEDENSNLQARIEELEAEAARAKKVAKK